MKRMYYMFIIIYILCIGGTFANPRIAIIGGGIGGTSCAYFLKQLFSGNASVHLFEHKKIGGRLSLLNVSGDYFESGGSIIHPRNLYMNNFVNLLGLKKRAPDGGRWGIYDGNKFVFKDSNWAIVTFGKLYWKYGWDIFKLDLMIQNILKDFDKIYKAQEAGQAFTTVQNMLGYMNPSFPNMTQETISSYMLKQGFSKAFIDELVQSVTLVNYGQTTDINAFVGSVALAGSESNLWSVLGGNQQVPVGLLKHSNVQMIRADVTSITLKKDGTFQVNYDLKINNHSISQNYDHVIIAMPITWNTHGIKFNGFAKDMSKFRRTYHRTVSTFIRAKLKNKLFQTNDLPNNILTNNASFIFKCLGENIPVSGVMNDKLNKVYKIFSDIPMSAHILENLFEDFDDIKMEDWLAYPHYEVPENIPPFFLHPGLYYINAIELAASAMEMSVIGARNAALLCYNTWNHKIDLIDSAQRIYKDEL